MKKIFMVLLVFTLFFTGLFAQDEDLTIDEAYLRQAQQILTVSSRAYENDRDSKMEAIDNIRMLIDNGTFDNETTEVVKILKDLGMEGTARIYMENGSATNYFTDVRIEAAKALGEIGGESAVNALVDILKVDDEPAVLAEAVKSLAENMEDDDIQTQLYIADTMHSQTAFRKDNRFASFYLDAVEKMYDNGVMLQSTMIDEVVGIANRHNGYDKANYIRAKAVLDHILGFDEEE